MTSLFYIIKSPLRKAAGLSLLVTLVITCLSCFSAKAQYFDIEGNHKRTTIPFQMIRDLIIIHLKIKRQEAPFQFCTADSSGVGLMLITDPKLVDSINVSDKRTIKISGLGKGEDYEAYITSPLNVNIPGLVSYDVVAAILKTDHFGLSGFAGIPIHGRNQGYEFFNNLAVKIDFSDSTLTASKPKYTKFFGKGNRIPITIENRKPFVHAKVTFPNGAKADDKLILDLGAGHPLSLENVIEKHGMPDKFIAANLGVGLTGPIEGFISRLNEVEIGKFKLKNVLASFPVDNRKGEFEREKRDGNLGIGILKRFTLIVDYPDSAVYLKPVVDF